MSGIPAGAGQLLGKRLGKYEILALLALGGTAEIYLARIGGAAGFEKYVVVKCLHDHLADDQEFVKMFLDEARLAAHLDHSNIVQTMELGEHENRYYMVMEFLAGMSLAMIARRAGERLPGGMIPVPLALNIIAQACAGLHYAHERSVNGKLLNIVHRDISPQNLVISFEGVVKVVDFGIAKAELRETKTKSGTIKGKFAYMSPEQCIAANVDRRTDVFALGVIAHELLTGQRLFKRVSPYETYQAVIDCNVQPPSKINIQVDPALDDVVMRAVAKDKEGRYPTAEAFGDAILGYLHHRGKGSGPGDVSRFFEAKFGQEIDEHGARMRELIEGRDNSTLSGWDEEDDKRQETVDLGGRPSEMSLSTADISMVSEGNPVGAVSGAIGDEESEDDDDESRPAEKTRIEANPLELLKQMDVEASKQPPRNTGSMPAIVKPKGVLTPPGVRVNVPEAHNKTMIQEAGAIAASPARPVMPPSGPLRLPDPPTAPAGMRPSSQRFALPSQAASLKTVVADDLDPSGGIKTVIADDIDGPGGAKTVVAGDLAISTPPPGMPLPGMPVPGMPVPGMPVPASAPTQPQPIQQPGYPMMSAEMSAQIARGADVFPSGPSGPDPNLMSPVGAQYPQQVDWDQAAAMPARALPTWMMVVLFLVAIGVALGLTILVAKGLR